MTTSIAPVPPAASRLSTGAHRKQVVVIGAGVGGLASAVRLAAAGYRVTVLERHEGPGGRAGTWRSEGFTFDTGPSLVMMLECWRDLFAAAGRRLEDYLDLVQIDPCYRLTFTDGSTFEMTSQLNRLVENMEALEPGAGTRVHRWLAETGELYHGGLAFIRRNMHNPLSMMNISAIGARGGMRALGDLQAMARRHFRDERLQQAITFQTLYLGISPYRSPGVYGLLAHSEVAGGIHYPMGGMHQLPLALERLGTELGVEYRYGSPVTRLERDAGRITAATTADGHRLTADAFVANSDLPWTYQELLGEKLPTLLPPRFSCSVVLLTWASTGPTPACCTTTSPSPATSGRIVRRCSSARRCPTRPPSTLWRRPAPTRGRRPRAARASSCWCLRRARTPRGPSTGRWWARRSRRGPSNGWSGSG